MTMDVPWVDTDKALLTCQDVMLPKERHDGHQNNRNDGQCRDDEPEECPRPVLSLPILDEQLGPVQ